MEKHDADDFTLPAVSPPSLLSRRTMQARFPSRVLFAFVSLAILASLTFAADPPPKPAHAQIPELDLKLLRAVRSEDVATVRALLDAGASPNPQPVEGTDGPPLVAVVESAFFMDATRGKPSPQRAKRGAEKLEIARLLLDRGADPNIGTVKHGCTPLVFAVYWDLTEFAELLLARGAKTEPPTGPLPLNMAVGHHSAPMIELLLKNKANINARDNSGWTPLRMATACAKDHPEILEMLVKAGATDMGDSKVTPKLPDQ